MAETASDEEPIVTLPLAQTLPAGALAGQAVPDATLPAQKTPFDPSGVHPGYGEPLEHAAQALPE